MDQLTAGLAAVLGGADVLDWAGPSSGDGVFSCFRGFEAGFLAAGADAARGGGAPVPALHLTVAFSKASLILAFLMSAILSMIAFNGLSPTIFMR
jgi:hypothetical protein